MTINQNSDVLLEELKLYAYGFLLEGRRGGGGGGGGIRESNTRLLFKQTTVNCFFCAFF